jgi:serine/threonine protein kinase/tetratricopeptide (TPR) repeat protein
MSASESSANNCPRCGAEIPPDALEKVCPHCALADALGSSPEDHDTQFLALHDIPVPAGQKAAPEAGDAVKPDKLGSRFRTPRDKPGDRIGRYKLLEEIGEGGCGVVYVAEQEQPVRRRVALKAIKLGMDTRQVIARFEAERQALALMDHSNIAKVLDAGATETGRPYFVMELVRGIKITDYCDKNNLSTEERLKLFILVCSAIQHAHQKGIIHRDIKPSNILVTLHDGLPVPKVIDFGIAKATSDQRLTDKTIYTAFEQFIGTPAYMSPEQAEMSGLDIDTRSDIYSLGVLLYELLTGQTPFDAVALLKAGVDQMRRIIREQEPQRPSTRLSTLEHADLTVLAEHRRAEPPKLIRTVRGDLDWIVMRALEKDRTRRYETANGFAMDIQRHLNHEPVLAAAPSALYTMQKLARRHRLALATCAIVFLCLVGATVTSMLLVRAKQAEIRARVEAENMRHVQVYNVAQMILKEDMFASADARQRQMQAVAQVLGKTDVTKLEVSAATPPGASHPQNKYAEVEQFFTDAMKAMPTNESPAQVAQILRARGAFRAQHGHWEEAASDLARAVEVEPTEHWNWFLLAPVFVQAGDVFAYNEFRQAMLARFGSTAIPSIAERTAKACALLPVSGDAAESIGKLSSIAVNFGRNDGYLTYYQLAQGLCEYRQGRYASALEWMQRVQPQLAQDPLPYREAQMDFVVAMAQGQLEQYDKARATLSNGVEILEKKLPGLDSGDLGSSWHDILIAHILMREARALGKKIRQNDHPAEAFRKNQENEQTLTAALRASGFQFTLSLLSDGKYRLDVPYQPLSDLSFLMDAPIEELILPQSSVIDLSPLRTPLLSASLRQLDLWHIPAIDFSPIAACTNLEYFDVADTALADLEVVRGRKLRVALLSGTKITDISILAGMPLERVVLSDTAVTNLSPLLQCPTLTELVLPRGASNVNSLRALPRLAKVSYELLPGGFSKLDAEEFWFAYDHGGITAGDVPILSQKSVRDPQDSLLAMKVAALQAWFGQDVDYAATCKRVIETAEQAAKTEDVRERAAKNWCLRPSDDVVMLPRVLALAREAAKAELNMDQRSWYQQTLGMAEFRAGNDKAAETAFLRAEEEAETGDWHPEWRQFIQGPSRFYRAMMLFRKGQDQAAKDLFHEAEAQIPPLPENAAHVLPVEVSQDQLLCWLAYKEAAALLKIGPTTKP